MKNTKIKSSLIAMISLFYSCGQKESNCAWDKTTDVFHNLSVNNKANVYTGNDTLLFISNIGDTAFLYGQGKKSYFDLSNSGAGNTADCGGTPQYAYHNENLDLLFIGTNKYLTKIEYKGLYDLNSFQELTRIYVNDNFSGYYTSFFTDSTHYNSIIYINGINYNCLVNTFSPFIYYSSQIGIVRIDSIYGKNWILKR